jgi:hypothetical protein
MWPRILGKSRLQHQLAPRLSPLVPMPGGAVGQFNQGVIDERDERLLCGKYSTDVFKPGRRRQERMSAQDRAIAKKDQASGQL